MKLNHNVFSFVAYGLTFTLVLEVIAYIVLAFMQIPIPTELAKVTLANFTGLFGLLVKVNVLEDDLKLNKSIASRGDGTA